MQTPNPLPEPGWWLVINGDELYEVGHCKGTDNHGARVWCSTLPDDAGVYYWSVNEGEAIWTPWDDPSVSAVFPTLAEAEAYIDAHRKPLAAAFVLGQVGAYALRTPPRAPEPPDDDPDRLTCDVCGGVETAADLTPDWNGETGAHRSCEARPETVARYVVTIRHRQGGDPYTPAMLRAVAEVMAAALSAAGIEATATAEAMPDPDRPCTFGDAAGTPCGDGPDAHEWHHDGTHTYE